MPNVVTHPTPNPNSLKFTKEGVRFSESGPCSYDSASDADDNPIAARLLALRGVANVFIVPEFVTITKHPAAHWDLIAQSAERIITEYAEPSSED